MPNQARRYVLMHVFGDNVVFVGIREKLGLAKLSRLGRVAFWFFGSIFSKLERSGFFGGEKLRVPPKHQRDQIGRAHV